MDTGPSALTCPFIFVPLWSEESLTDSEFYDGYSSRTLWCKFILLLYIVTSSIGKTPIDPFPH